MPFFYSKRPPSPLKTEVLHEKACLFLLKKTSQPIKKLNFRMKKLQKSAQKRYQKEHPAPQKPEVLHEKLKTALPRGILKKKSLRPKFTKFLNA